MGKQIMSGANLPSRSGSLRRSTLRDTARQMVHCSADKVSAGVLDAPPLLKDLGYASLWYTVLDEDRSRLEREDRMPRYRLTHLRGPYGSEEKFVDFDAEDDTEATRIANDKRQMFAMQLQRIGGPVFRTWPALRPDL